MNHLEDIPRLSSRELARLTFTHPTTVLRLSKKLGFEGFNDLKVNLLFKLKTMEAASAFLFGGMVVCSGVRVHGEIPRENRFGR